MKRTCTLGAVAALGAIATVNPHASAATLDLGTFVNFGSGNVAYTGEHGAYVSHFSQSNGDQNPYVVVAVDLAGLLASVGADGLSSVTISDTGLNSYGELSPGADVDYFVFQNIGNAAVTYTYQGPNGVHNNEDHANWALRLSSLDSYSGSQDAWHMTQLSLGNQGAVTALLSQPGNDEGFVIGGVSGGLGPTLLFSEHGSVESFHVTMEVFTTAVPAPGAAALALLGLGSRRRRMA